MLTQVLCIHSCLWGWVLGWKWSKRRDKPPQQQLKSFSLPLYKQQHPSRRRLYSAFPFSKSDDDGFHWVLNTPICFTHMIQMYLHSKYEILVQKTWFKKTLATTYAIEKLSCEKVTSDSNPNRKAEKKVIKPKLANHSILDKRCSPAGRRLFHQSF